MREDCCHCPEPKYILAALWRGTLGIFAGRMFWVWYHVENRGDILVAGGLGYLGSHFVAELM